MTTTRTKLLIGAAFVGAATMIAASAQAYWGDPWRGPRSGPGWGNGAWSERGYPYSGYGAALDRTHERQSTMQDHRAAMRSVARMLSGQRNFDRAEAIGLAREIEAGAGENLTRLFKSGDWRRSPLSRARVGDDMDTFKAKADALKAAAGELADALEKQPSAEDFRAGRAWSPDWRRSARGWGMGGPYRYGRWRNEGGTVTKEAYDAFHKLQATCYGCHVNFRSPGR